MSIRKNPRFEIPFVFGIVTSLFLLSATSCLKSPQSDVLPVIRSVDRYSATIELTSDVAEDVEIWYGPDGGEKKRVAGKTQLLRHEFKLSGLLPDKQYSYGFNFLAGREFSFRTAPLASSPFRFCVLNGPNVPSGKVNDQFPDFLITATSALRDTLCADPAWREIRTRIPFLSVTDNFSWGNLTFGSGTGRSGNGSVRVLIVNRPEDYTEANGAGDSSAMVLVVLSGDSLILSDSQKTTRFCAAGNSLVIEAQGDEMRAGIIGDSSGSALPYQFRKGTLSFTKTCVLCRRLLEKKQYQSSIDYYKRFIAENRDQRLHDDALFQIANTYDKYLFDYSGAVVAYKELLDKYPDCNFAATARFRLDYIQKYSDFDFAPLRTFEKARLMQDGAERSVSINNVESVLAKYSDCSLRDELLLWLGDMLADSGVQKSIGYFSLLAANGKDPENRYKAAMKIGDVYYAHKRFPEAVTQFRSVLSRYPDRNTIIESKLDRSILNVTRERISWGCIGVLAVFFLMTVLLPKIGLALPRPLPFLSWVIVNGIVVFIPILIWKDALYPALWFAIWFAVAMVMAGYLTGQFSIKVRNMGFATVSVLALSVIASLMVTLSMLYILVKQFHYLFVFERIIP